MLQERVHAHDGYNDHPHARAGQGSGAGASVCEPELDERTDEIIKAVNHSDADQAIRLAFAVPLADGLDSCTPTAPGKFSTRRETIACEGRVPVPANSFVVARLKRRG